MTPEEIEGLAIAIRTVIDKKLAPIEERVKVLESRPTMRYEGTWKSGVGYEAGTFITDHGSLWYAKAATVMRPGSGDSWRLVAKKGRDAR